MRSPPLKTSVYAAFQAHVPVLGSCQVLVKAWPACRRVLSATVTSATNRALSLQLGWGVGVGEAEGAPAGRVLVGTVSFVGVRGRALLSAGVAGAQAVISN